MSRGASKGLIMLVVAACGWGSACSGGLGYRRVAPAYVSEDGAPDTTSLTAPARPEEGRSWTRFLVLGALLPAIAVVTVAAGMD